MQNDELRDIKAHLKELHTNAGKHELQQRGDNDDVPDGADGYEHTLDHMLWKQKRTQFKTNNTQHLHYGI